jgi:hypothetical protein
VVIGGRATPAVGRRGLAQEKTEVVAPPTRRAQEAVEDDGVFASRSEYEQQAKPIPRSSEAENTKVFHPDFFRVAAQADLRAVKLERLRDEGAVRVEHVAGTDSDLNGNRGVALFEQGVAKVNSKLQGGAAVKSEYHELGHLSRFAYQTSENIHEVLKGPKLLKEELGGDLDGVSGEMYQVGYGAPGTRSREIEFLAEGGLPYMQRRIIADYGQQAGYPREAVVRMLIETTGMSPASAQRLVDMRWTAK